MRLEHHIVLSATVSGAIFAISQSWPATISSFIAGIFLDADHVLDYLREYGLRLNIKELFRASYERAFKKTFLIFHAWEWAPLIAIVLWITNGNPWLVGAAIGWLQHLLADQLANTPNKWAYSIIWRWRHDFDHKVSFPLHER